MLRYRRVPERLGRGLERDRSPLHDADELRLVGALDWISGELATAAAARLGEREPLGADEAPVWTAPAGSDPVVYQWWERETARELARARRDGPLPSTGPLVSVLVPVYRPEHWYFRQCVASVTAQTYSSWELCLCDDGSGDPELSALLAELGRADPRIKFVVEPKNGGISNATNHALELASGEFVALLDHDDVLDPEALAEIAAALSDDPDADVLYTDEDKIDAGKLFDPQLKPDWSPDLLLSWPYLGHMLVVRRELLVGMGGFRSAFDGSQDYDVMLRSTELARRVVHVPRVLYHWRCIPGSAAGDALAKPWAHEASRRVLEDAISRRGLEATVEESGYKGWYHLRRRIEGSPSVTIVVPFRDQAAMTARCLYSIDEAPGYDNYEVVLVDNDSIEPETTALLSRVDERSVKVVAHPGAFNWSSVNNAAAAATSSDLLLFLNNDVEATSRGWLSALVEHAQRPEVGAVGARLLFPDGKIQHAGVALGVNGIAWHLFSGLSPGGAYFGWDRVLRPFSAVTGACMMTRREVFEELGGFDERLVVGLNDVDYCMRLADRGYRVLYTPLAELVHHESVSRGMSGVRHDMAYFVRKWGRERLLEDPFYNPNLSLFGAWCSLRQADEEERWHLLVDELTDERLSAGG
jgi:GT2 family glycosyltransferase